MHALSSDEETKGSLGATNNHVCEQKHAPTRGGDKGM